MRSIINAIHWSMMFSLVSCFQHEDVTRSLKNEIEIGSRLYCGVNSMKIIDRYPEYASYEAARSSYGKWKRSFVSKYGKRNWDEFCSSVKEKCGEPRLGHEEILLDPNTL